VPNTTNAGRALDQLSLLTRGRNGNGRHSPAASAGEGICPGSRLATKAGPSHGDRLELIGNPRRDLPQKMTSPSGARSSTAMPGFA